MGIILVFNRVKVSDEVRKYLLCRRCFLMEAIIIMDFHFHLCEDTEAQGASWLSQDPLDSYSPWCEPRSSEIPESPYPYLLV